jgi:hypothetical protein
MMSSCLGEMTKTSEVSGFATEILLILKSVLSRTDWLAYTRIVFTGVVGETPSCCPIAREGT